MKPFKTTKDIKVSKKIVNQVIGQPNAVEIIKKAAKQRRHVLLIGESGTGKSLIGQALAELLPNEKLQDIVSFPNEVDENIPIIRTFKRGEGKKLVEKVKLQLSSTFKYQNIFFFIILIIAMLTPWWIRREYGDVMAAASLIGSMIFLAAFVLFMNLGRKSSMLAKIKVPKLLIDNSKQKKAPFLDASGAHAGALLGDCLHDPLQCLSSSNIIQKGNKKTKISTEINHLLKKHKKDLIKQKDYQATFLNKGELEILGEKNNKIKPVEVLSVNKHPNKHPYLYKITTESGKELVVTPEHKVAINKNNTKKYVKSSKLSRENEIFTYK